MNKQPVPPSIRQSPDLTPQTTSGCVWVQSDLQLSDPRQAEQVLSRAVADMKDLTIQPAAIWCLGDAMAGKHLADLEQVAMICIEQLESFGVPICYVMGNHEMDYRRATGENRFVLYERACSRKLWHTTSHLADPWFARTCLGCDVVFFGDHADPAGTWYTSHHACEAGASLYPYPVKAWQELTRELARAVRPAITVAHYAYPGGQRPGALMTHLLPVPAAVRLHLYGHAHIGDMVWNRERPWQRDNPVKDQMLRQYNISALENKRSPGSHSAVLHFEQGEPVRLDVRCHMKRRWIERFDVQRSTDDPLPTAPSADS